MSAEGVGTEGKLDRFLNKRRTRAKKAKKDEKRGIAVSAGQEFGDAMQIVVGS